MFVIGTLGALICLTCMAGFVLHMKRESGFVPPYAAKSLIGGAAGLFFIAFAVVSAQIFVPSTLFAQEAALAVPDSAFGLGFLGAGISVGLACIGTGIATGMACSAAIGAVSDNPKMLGQSLLFVGLSEGIAIYGLIIAIQILGRLA